jgi:hypothetical protein
MYPKDAGTAKELFHAADRALYAAKRRGGGICFAHGDHDEALATPHPMEVAFDWNADTVTAIPAEMSDDQSPNIPNPLVANQNFLRSCLFQ